MKKNVFTKIPAVVILSFAVLPFIDFHRTRAQAQLEFRQSVERKSAEYRTAIKDSYKIDINNFKDKIPGGHADGKPVINYDLQQLLAGINFERNHTKDNMLAFELAMDNLERIRDYYTRLERMEWESRSEKLRDM